MAKVLLNDLPDIGAAKPVNLHYDFDGRVFLRPNNITDETGDPRNIPIGMPEDADGVMVYGGTSPQALVQQALAPVSTTRTTFMWDKLITEGQQPPSGVQLADLPTPGAPKLKAVALTGTGFQPGTYRLSYTWEVGGKHTLVCPDYVQVEEAWFAGATRYITVYLPQTVPTGVTGIGLWLSERNGTAMWLQRVVPTSGSKSSIFDLTGPFRYDKKAPTSNETAYANPSTPNVGYSRAGDDLLPSTSPHYQVWATIVTAQGETMPSDASDVFSVNSTKSNTTLLVEPKSKPSGALGWRCYVRQLGGNTHVVHPKDQSADRALSFSQDAQIYSYDPNTWGHTSWRVTQRALPTANTTGAPDPVDSLFPLTSADVYGGTGLHTATGSVNYYVALAFMVNGVEGPRGPYTKLAVPQSQAIRVRIPKKVNKLLNAAVNEVGNDGYPLDHQMRQHTTGGGTVSVEGSRVKVVANATVSGTLSPEHAFPPSPVDRTRDHLIVGEAEVTSHTAGSLQVVLQQFAVEEPTIGVTAQSAPEVVLATATGAGTVEYDVEAGPTGTVAWGATTVSAWVLHRFTGTDRRMTVYAEHNGIIEGKGKPRKALKKARRGEKDEDDPNVGNDVPYPEGTSFVVGRPRASKAPPVNTPLVGNLLYDRPSQTGTPVETTGFESGLGTWITVASGGGAVTLNTASPLSGTQDVRCADTDNAAVGNAYVYKDYATSHSRAVQGLFKIDAMPPSGQSVSLLALMSGWTRFARINLHGDGRLELVCTDEGQADRSTYFASGVAAGTSLRLELQASGVGATAHRTGTNASVFARAKVGGDLVVQPVARHLDLNLPTMFPTRVGLGIVSESSATGTANVRVDDVNVYDRGSTYFWDHDALGRPLIQGHYYRPADATPRQDRGIQNFRIPVKPGTVYSLGVWARYRGVTTTTPFFYVTFHRLTGDTVQAKDISDTAGFLGTASWQDHRLEGATALTTPADCYEMRITSRDVGVGEFVWQDLCVTEGSALLRDGLRATSGTLTATYDTRTPKSDVSPPMWKTWLGVEAEVETLPTGTTFSIGYASGDVLPIPDVYVSSLAGVTQARYLQIRCTLTGDGVLTPVLSPRAPVLNQSVKPGTVLRADGTELDGGTIVTGFPHVAHRPPVDVRQRGTGRHYRQKLAPPVSEVGEFRVQFFSLDGIQEFESNAMTELWTVESWYGQYVTVMILEQPEVKVEPRTAKFHNGQYYYVYGTAEIGRCEVVDVVDV